MIKIYFGPYEVSPVDELSYDERTLWFDSLHELVATCDRDFWTNNPAVLDQYPPEAVYVWSVDEGVWTRLIDNPVMQSLSFFAGTTSQMAMSVYAMIALRQNAEQPIITVMPHTIEE